jgi:glycosyltransferase involved in cell wall biosynthesis
VQTKVNSAAPWVTVAVPSFNQGRFLDATLRSIFAQSVPVEVMLADGGSTDETQRVIARWGDQLTWWRSAPDKGQSASINEAIGRGRAPFVCWMNSDDLFLPGGLATLIQAMKANPGIAVAYGGCHLIDENGGLIGLCRGKRVSERSLSRRSVVPQPASLIRREAWDLVGGLQEHLHFSLDYDLWWRMYRSGLSFTHINTDIAAARFHPSAKSFTYAREMYAEAKSVVRDNYGSLPLKWRIKEPFSVLARQPGSFLERIARAYRVWSMRIAVGQMTARKLVSGTWSNGLADQTISRTAFGSTNRIIGDEVAVKCRIENS